MAVTASRAVTQCLVDNQQIWVLVEVQYIFTWQHCFKLTADWVSDSCEHTLICASKIKQSAIEIEGSGRH